MRETAKDFMAMDAKQLAKATKQFDEDSVVEKTRPLTKQDRLRWNKLKSRRQTR